MLVRTLIGVVALVAQSGLANALERTPPKCEALAGVWQGYASGPDYQGLLLLHVGRTVRKGWPPNTPNPHNGASLPDDYAAHGLAAALDAPAQHAFKLPLNGVLREDQRVEFALPGRGWRYVGTLSADGSTISGDWTGMGGLYAFGPRGFSLTRWKPGDPSVPTEFKCVAPAP